MSNPRNKAPRSHAQTAAKKDAEVELRSVRFTAAKQTNVSKFAEMRQLNDHALSLKRSMSAHVQANSALLLSNPTRLIADYKLFGSAWLNAWERQAMFQDVMGTYQCRLSRSLARGKFFVQRGWTCQRYLKTVAKRGQVVARPGWVKPGTFELKTRTTPLTRAANLLMQLDLDKLILFQCSGEVMALLVPLYGKPKLWARLLQLVTARQARLLSSLKVHQFRTGTHRRNPVESRSRIIKDETNGKFEWFYALRIGVGQECRFVHLPLTFDKHYLTPDEALLDKGHIVKFSRNKVHVVCTREAGEPAFKPKGKLLGLDANTKHNLLATSDSRAFDYNRLWLDILLAQLLKLDATKGAAGLNFRDRARLAKVKRANEAALKRLLHDVLEQFEADGVTDLVLEDLSRFRGTMLPRHPKFEQKYTRLLRLLRLSSLKDWIASQAEKRGMRAHLTHAAYSSQECPMCHHVSRGNRTTQETFSCEACGHTAPADFVSGINLAHRMTSDVLRSALHAFDKFGRASPLPMSRAALKSLLTAQSAGGVIELSDTCGTKKRTARMSRAHEETPFIAA